MGGEIKAPVIVPRAVLVGILAVRDSGETNMFDADAAAKIALALGHDTAAAWIADRANRAAYAEGILRGFEAADTDGPCVRPGAVLRYIGTTHPGLTGLRVKVVGRLDQRLWEVAPWVEEAARFSWVTSDALESELLPLEEDE